MATTIDARGLSCPQPVLLLTSQMKKQKKGEVVILVDTDTSKENVIRSASNQGWEVRDIEALGEFYRISIAKD
jgi:tRNA 2-thiouridine synthesizing protein A